MLTLGTFQLNPQTTLRESGLEMRLWYNPGFLDVNDETVRAGNGSTGFYIPFTCTIASSIVTVQGEDIFTTLDANVQSPQSIQVFARLFSNGSPKDWVFTGWVIPSEAEYPGGSITLAQLTIYNEGANTLANPPTTYLTAAETAALISASIGTTSYASSTHLGSTYLDVDPLVSTHPMAIGSNSSLVQNRYRIFDPRTYGAVCDGVTDDTAAYVACIAAMTSGGILVIPEGQSLIGGSSITGQILALTKASTVQGSGANSILLIKSDTPTNADVFAVNVPVQSPPEGNAALGTTDDHGYHFRNFTILPQSGTPARDSIRVDISAGNRAFYDSSFEGLSLGLHINGGSGYSINLLNDNGAGGPTITDGFYGLNIYNNWLFDGVHGIFIGDSIRVRDNRFRGFNTSWNCTHVSGTGNFQFTGNNVTSDGGFKLQGTVGANISGNFFELYKTGASGVGGYVVSLGGGATSTVFENNLVSSLSPVNIHGLLVDTSSLIFIGKNTWNMQAGKNNITLSATAVSPVISNFGLNNGAGTVISNSSTSAAVYQLATLNNGTMSRIGSLDATLFNQTEIYSGFTSDDPGILEINRASATSNDTKFAGLSLVTNQTGTANNVGLVAFSNSAVVGAQKRIAQITGMTSGATDSGSLSLSTSNAGPLGERVRVTNAGAVNIVSGIIGANSASSPTTGLDMSTPGVVKATDGGSGDAFVHQAGRATVSTQFDKTNTTLTGITGLSVTLKAGRTYQIRGVLYVTADAAGGVKVALGGTATATAFRQQIVGIRNDTSAVGFTFTSGTFSVVGTTVSSSGSIFYSVNIDATITVNAAGTLTIQFSQSSATGTSSVLVGSSLIAEDVT